MASAIALTGQRFGNLVVTYQCLSDSGHALWNCQCDCGRRVRVRGAHLRSGRVVSCGCLRSNPAVRQKARAKVPRERRMAISQEGVRAAREAARENRELRQATLDKIRAERQKRAATNMAALMRELLAKTGKI